MLITLRTVIATIVLLAAIASRSTLEAQEMQWTVFDFQESGVSLRVPLGVFEAMPVDVDAQGRLFTSRDRKAQLLVGAFENADGRSLAAHRKYVVASNFANADIDYAPMRRSWFVLSGTMAANTFYQRVTFTCGGRLISSWAMIYPTAQKAFYDGLVERMHGSFRAGRGTTGNCRLASSPN